MSGAPCIFNHEVNGLVVSTDNRSLFINSGSRTDHGEIQDGNRQFSDLRETALTAIVLRVPTDARDLVLLNDRDASARPRLPLCRGGLRNAYDLAFSAQRRSLATENGPDSRHGRGDSTGCAKAITTACDTLAHGSRKHPTAIFRLRPSQRLPIFPLDSRLCAKATITTIPRTHRRRATSPSRVINLGPDADAYRDSQPMAKSRTLAKRACASAPSPRIVRRFRIGVRRGSNALADGRSKATASCLAGPRAIPTAMTLLVRSTTPVKTCCTSTYAKVFWRLTTRRVSPA